MAAAAFRLDHPCGLRIAKDLRESDARAAPGITTRDHGNGYVWYYLPRGEIAGQLISMGICFFQRELEFIQVAVMNDELYGSSFSDWSAEKERARAAATGKWLADIGFPVGTYSWGVVGAETDIKTGDGGGMVRFKRTV